MTGKFVSREEAEKFVKNIKAIVEKNKELKEELTKYKRAFEILKDKGIVEIEKYTNIGSVIYKAYGNERYLEKEEYELLEELMKGE